MRQDFGIYEIYKFNFQIWHIIFFRFEIQIPKLNFKEVDVPKNRTWNRKSGQFALPDVVNVYITMENHHAIIMGKSTN